MRNINKRSYHWILDSSQMATQFNPLRGHYITVHILQNITVNIGFCYSLFLYLFRKFIIYTTTLILSMLNLTLITSNFTWSKCFVTVDSQTVFHTEFVGILAVYILKPQAGHYFKHSSYMEKLLFHFMPTMTKLPDCLHSPQCISLFPQPGFRKKSAKNSTFVQQRNTTKATLKMHLILTLDVEWK